MSLLFETITAFGKAPALLDLATGEAISYEQLRDVLRSHEPADSGKPALVSGAPDLHAVLRVLAVLASGRLVVPLNPKLPPAEVRRRGLQIARAASGSDQPGTILFTSGSSGLPKAVLHDLESHVANATAASERIPLGPGCGWLLNLPLFHVSGLAVLVRCLLSGATVVIPDHSRPGNEAIRHPLVTHLSVVAVQLQRLLEAGAELSRLTAVLAGGGPFSSTLVDSALRAGVPFHLTYGMTETASQIATTQRLEGLPDPLHAGHPLPHTQVMLSPDREILVKSPGLARLVLDGSEWRSLLAPDDWYPTGDLGIFTPEGALCITGRKDRMLVSGGENVHPEAIEGILSSIPGIRRAAVVAVDHREYGQRPVAFVDGVVDAAVLRGFLAERLDRFAIPDRFFPWPDGVSSDAPKIDYPTLGAIARKAMSVG